jgi:hypothetical protein
MAKELKFIHITKTAGSAIEKAGIKHKIQWGMYHKEYQGWHEYFPLKNKKLKDKYDWFMVVRNPYERILSEYYCEWGGIGKKNIIHNQNQMNQYLMDKIKTYELKGKYGDHYSPQHKYVDKNYKIHILKFENLENDFNHLMKLYHLSHIQLLKVNSKEEKNNVIKFTIKDFSPELIRLINNVYDLDFSNFGYQKIVL